MNKKYPLVIGALLLTATTSFAIGTTFTDEASFASWYKDAVKHMQETGVVTGYADGSFKPNQDVTRGELSLMLDRYKEKIVDQKIKDAMAGVNGSIDEAKLESMVEEKIKAYMQANPSKIGFNLQAVLDNIEQYDDVDIDLKSRVIMAESGINYLAEAPDMEALEFKKMENIDLPEGYEAYKSYAGGGEVLDIYLHYQGEKLIEDYIDVVDEWYGPF